MLVKRLFFAMSAAGTLVSCTEPPTTSQTSDLGTSFSEQTVTLDDGQAAAIKLTQLIAANIDKAQIREAIRDGLRASPYAEHRLRVADFLGSTDGGPVANGIEARAGDFNYPEMSRLLASMGGWDIYVHREIKRREWRGGRDVLVGVGWEGINEVIAFDVDGQRADFDPRFGWPTRTVILLIPGEVLIPRVSPQPDTRGEVIQESYDGTFAAGLLTDDELDRAHEIREEFVQFGGGTLNQDQCHPDDGCTGGGGGSGNPWGFGSEVEGVSRLTLMSYHSVCDNPPLCNNLELRTKVDWPFVSDLYTSIVFSLPSEGCNDPFGTGNCEFIPHTIDVVIHPRNVPSSSGSVVKLVEFLELDSPGFPAFNPDDVWCPVPHSWNWNSQQILTAYGMKSDLPCFPGAEANVIISGRWTMDHP